jgi:hypothetical protein
MKKKTWIVISAAAVACSAWFCLADYPADLRESWSKWVAQYNRTMTEPDKAIGLSFDGASMSPTMSHKKAAWQHARLNYLLGRYDEKASKENKAALLTELAEFIVATNTPAATNAAPSK